MTEILRPFLSKYRQILWGNIDQYLFEEECFRSSFYSDYILWLSAILKMDFLKSPGKSASARPPRGMKLGILLYIQLTISFLIGRKRSVNFRNQRLGSHLAAD